MEIDVIIPLYKPGKELFTLLDKLDSQSAPYFLNLWSIILDPRLLHKTFSYDTSELRCSPEDSLVNSFSYLFR